MEMDRSSKSSGRSWHRTGLVAVLALSLAVLTPLAEAKRVGSGRSSVGRTAPSQPAFQRDAQPAKPIERSGNPQQGAQQQAPAAGAAQQAAQPARNRWLGPVAGLAAGLGLAALFSHLGMGEALAGMLGNMLLIAVVVFAGIWLFRRFMGGRSQAAGALAPAGAGYAMGAGDYQAKREPTVFNRESSPSSSGFGGVSSIETEALHASAGTPSGLRLPADFDAEAFVRQAKQSFVSLQQANDRGDVKALASLLGDELLASVRQDMEARGGKPQQTDVVTLDAVLIGYEETADEVFVVVRFDGMVREAADGAAHPFAEHWHIARARQAGHGWLVMGIESLDGGSMVASGQA